MNCINYKNTIQDNSRECEWCGNTLSESKLEKKIFLVEDIKNRGGLGTLLLGKYNDGTQIQKGDSISYSYQGVVSNATRGIELSSKLISTYNGNQNIIILIK